MRTRFAPSPTGFLHIGGLRTALFSYLVAKKAGGTFFLRIEDTDQSREVEGSTLNILRTFAWAGMPPDEGVVLAEGPVRGDDSMTERGKFGPYFQSKRLAIYREHVDRLLRESQAYRCFCTRERLEEMRKKQEALHQAPMYDRTCLHIPQEEAEQRAKNEPHVIRMRVPEGILEAKDRIRGTVSFPLKSVDDQVILKSDGFPTYHLAHVVDDHLMETSLVIRGEEWLPSLPKHLLLFKAFGWEPPEFAHVPLLLAKGGGKLSKRNVNVAAEAYKQMGYLPEAMINFIALLGWNPGTTQEIFALEELVEQFTLERVQKAGAIFDTSKLDWLQGQWIRKMSKANFVEYIRPSIMVAYPQAEQDPHFAEKAALVQARITHPYREAASMLSFFYEEPKVTVELLVNEKQGVRREDLPAIFDVLLKTLTEVSPWNVESLTAAIQKVIEENQWKKGQLLWPLRAVLTGLPFSPGAFEVAGVLGKEKTVERLQRCKKQVSP